MIKKLFMFVHKESGDDLGFSRGVDGRGIFKKFIRFSELSQLFLRKSSPKFLTKIFRKSKANKKKKKSLSIFCATSVFFLKFKKNNEKNQNFDFSLVKFFVWLLMHRSFPLSLTP